MLKIRNVILVLGVLMSPLASSATQVSVGLSFPNVSIGINVPAYPRLARVSGYPVYYAPQLDANYFFYDGMYWVYQDDYWYASSWYNGPWARVDRSACSGVHFADSPSATIAVLLRTSAAGSRMRRHAGGIAGAGLGAAQKRLGPMGPPCHSDASSVANLPATVFWGSISPAIRAAEPASTAAISLPAA
jgi:hypothetical protein